MNTQASITARMGSTSPTGTVRTNRAAAAFVAVAMMLSAQGATLWAFNSTTQPTAATEFASTALAANQVVVLKTVTVVGHRG